MKYMEKRILIMNSKSLFTLQRSLTNKDVMQTLSSMMSNIVDIEELCRLNSLDLNLKEENCETSYTLHPEQ